MPANNHVTVWNKCLSVIRGRIDAQAFSTWFEPIVPLRVEGGNVLLIQVPTQYFYEWLEEHFLDALKEAIEQQLGPGARLEYSIIVDQGNAQNKPQTVQLPTRKTTGPSHGPNGARIARTTAEMITNPFESKVLTQDYQAAQLNASYSFESYIEGACNRLARSAGWAVANRPGTSSFNPLMVYGGVGLGKTHLVQAIGNRVKQQWPEKFVLYVSSERFVNQFMESVKTNSIEAFGNYYLHVDVLIIDDVQFFAGKVKTQDMFFNIFNHLYQTGKQIVMTSDRSPREIAGIEDRLLSRFKWGLTADVQSPDLETRMAIIQSKMIADGIDIPDRVVEYLAYSVDTNMRELEGVLISIIAQSSVYHREIDLEMAKEALRHVVQQVDTEVNLDFIQKTVADHLGTTVELLKDKARQKDVVAARQLAMYFAKEMVKELSLKAIGQGFGGRDHTTVLHSLEKINDSIARDPAFRALVEEVRTKLQGGKS